MSQSVDHRKSSLKVGSNFKEPPGPLLKFQWSVSAANLALLNETSPIIFPSIDADRSGRKVYASSPSLSDQKSVTHSSISSYKTTCLPRIAKKRQSPMSTKQIKTPDRSSPLSLTYAQVYQISPHVLAKRSTRARLSIYPVSDDKEDNISLVNSKVSLTSRPSISSTTTLSLLPTNPENRLTNDNLIRLQTLQLRRLNVSEKYMNEVKKLYFNATTRSFVPRMTLPPIS